jgi:transposase-like protein
VSQAVVVAVGVATYGRREFLGFDVGDNETFGATFLRTHKARGIANRCCASKKVCPGAVSTLLDAVGRE